MFGFGLPQNAASLKANATQTVINPFPRELDFANTQLSQSTTSLLSIIGVMGFFGLCIAVYVQKRCSTERRALLVKFDYLFTDNHSVDDGASPVSRATALGGCFSLLAVCLMLPLALLLSLQNTLVPPLSTEVSTGQFLAEPQGYFGLQVTAYGSFSAAACAAMTLTALDSSDWSPSTGPSMSSPVYSAKTSACTVMWQCRGCSIGSAGTNPSFKLSSPLPSWANFFNVTLWTPSLVVPGDPDPGRVFSANQMLFPSNTLTDRIAFRSVPALSNSLVDGADPVITFLLTPFAVISGPPSNLLTRVTFQPSVLGFNPGTTQVVSQASSGPQIMNAAGPASLLAGTPGFELNVALSRNSINIVTTKMQADAFNLIVLILSLMGSVIGALATVFTQIEDYCPMVDVDAATSDGDPRKGEAQVELTMVNALPQSSPFVSRDEVERLIQVVVQSLTARMDAFVARPRSDSENTADARRKEAVRQLIAHNRQNSNRTMTALPSLSEPAPVNPMTGSSVPPHPFASPSSPPVPPVMAPTAHAAGASPNRR